MRSIVISGAALLIGASFFYHLSAPPLFAVATSPALIPEKAPPPPQPSWPLFDPQALKHDNHLWFATEVLFFQPSVGSFSYGTESSSTSSIQHGHVKSPDFNWNAGYRAGIGYKLPHDKWDLFGNYTYLYGSAQGKAGHIVFPTWASNWADSSPFYASSAKANWNMHLNMGDLELGRNCFAGKWLSLRPFVGVRGMTLDQKYHINYKGGTVAPSDTDRVTLNNDFWGVGVRMGVNSLWGCGQGISLYGNGSASLLSGHFDVHEREKLLQADLQKMNIESTTSTVVVDADISLGLQWDYLFSQDRYHFGVKLGWEFDVFFNQNQLFNFASPSSFRCQNDDLAFQGVTLGFRLDF